MKPTILRAKTRSRQSHLTKKDNAKEVNTSQQSSSTGPVINTHLKDLLHPYQENLEINKDNNGPFKEIMSMLPIFTPE